MKLLCIIVFYVCFYETCAKKYGKSDNSKRVCVIGAGVAGLTTARYLKDEGINFTVFEATKHIGGTWRYDPRTGFDEHGLPIHTSMYKHLRTNLPKPTMELRGFPLPDELPSYPTWKEYYEYLKAYAKHFDIEKYIKFEHNIILVRRENGKWKVKYVDLVTDQMYDEYFDYVVVGNGHHSKPNMPNIPGEKLFKGTIIHSHNYRLPDPYKDRRVLLIGSGPSGMDISLDIAEVSKTLIHSHHSVINWHTNFPPNFIRKPDVREFNETGVFFVDGTYEEIDDVVYCTGFLFDFPFLDETSELTISTKSVSPLYLSLVNINQPTMIMMGLVVRACLVVSTDAQARFTASLINGNFTLPPKEVMIAEWEARVNKTKELGQPLSYIHVLAYDEDDYYAELSKISGIEKVPTVLYKIRLKDIQSKIEDLYTYRNYEYKIIDDNTFVRTLIHS